MPEGDTIHKIAAYLEPRLVGRRLARGWARRPRTRAREIVLDGRRIEAVGVHGKHLFIAFDDGTTLRSHLGMYGSWHTYRLGEGWRKPPHRASIELVLDDVVFVCFSAMEVELVRAASVRERQIGARLGPDLLAPTFDLALIAARARDLLEPAAPLADVLLDQRVASGIGNVYKSEVLFLEQRHPLLRLAQLDDQGIERLFAHAADLMARNIGPRRRVTRFERGAAGSSPAPGASSTSRHWVYGRGGETCFRCGGRIESARLGRDWRSTFWCPSCQAAPSPS